MQTIERTTREHKNRIYEHFAEVVKAMASAARLELLDLLIQGPRSVELLAAGLERPLSTVSQHLQVLKRAELVQTHRFGTTIEYALSPGVAEAFVRLRGLAEDVSAPLRAAKEELYADVLDVIGIDELQKGLHSGEVVLLDVRPESEYKVAHMKGALSVPVAEIADRLPTLPQDGLFVATCRGPYCAFAADAVRELLGSGRRAVRFEGSVADWALLEGELASGQ